MHAMASDLLGNVREALRLIGAIVVERPCPSIVVTENDGWEAYYSPHRHEVRISRGAIAAPSVARTLVHELAHSQQPMDGKARAYRRADGSIDGALWMKDPLEKEACAVEILAPLMGSQKLERILAVLGEARIAKEDLMAWILYMLKGDLTSPKPAYVARRARLIINAALRAPL